MFIINTCKDIKQDIFKELSTNIKFENITKGRQGAILIDKIKGDKRPIVRTTTNYNFPVQYFLLIHKFIIESIKKEIQFNIEFNNAMIEIYDNVYNKMKFHTDQYLDLNDNSYICLFSCYEKKVKYPRKLIVKKKGQENQQEILLENNSFVLFNTFTNKNYLHKIILDNNTKENDNKWLGITFRLSKTFVQFVNGVPFINNKQLTIATENEKREFYKHKSLENLNIKYNYPEINYTINNQDIIN